MAELKPLSELPIKHQLFVLGWIEYKGDNAKAARFAGYSPKTAGQQGHDLFKKLESYIKPKAQEMVTAVALSAEQTLKGLSLIASSDIGDYVSWNSKTKEVVLKDFEALTPQQRYCIESVEQVETQFAKSVRLRLCKKQPALDTLAECHNLKRRKTANKGLIVNINEAPKKIGEASTLKPTSSKRTLNITFSTLPHAQEQGGVGNGHAKK